MNSKEKEFLKKKYQEYLANYAKNNAEFNANPSIAMIEPFKIADDLYYVGDRKVCIHLIDTGDGLILIDSGYIGATHLLVDSIWRMGFDPKNIRWIIHTHGHTDHYGSSEEFRRMYGAKLAISKVDADFLRERKRRAQESNTIVAKSPEFDHEIEDGEIFSLGSVKIRCVLTPGHTPGVLSLFFHVTDNGNTYLAGLFGGAGINTIKLPAIYSNNYPENAPEQMLRSIEKVWDEEVVIHLGNHPNNNHTISKREQQIQEGGNPFVAPESWHDFLRQLKAKIEKVIEENEALKKEMAEL